MERNIFEIITEVLIMAFIGFMVAFVITRAVMPTTVLGRSMNPTLVAGQKLAVNKLAYKMGDAEYEDLIAFKPQDNLEERYIKRIIGLPGDTIEIRDNRIFRNELILTEDYINEEMITDDFEEYELKEDEYFVLGDNRNNSKDSRYFGPVKERHIIGKIVGY